MQFLLDTHALIWSLESSPKLSAKAGEILAAAEHTKWVSYASLWEVTIKVAQGKIRFQRPWSDTVRFLEENAPETLLNVVSSHLAELLRLPFHHRDPFDRMLIAQALAGDFTLVSCDEIFDAYGVKRVW